MKIIFDEKDVKSFKCVIADIIGVEITNERATDLINKLPDLIIGEAFQWGFTDTCVLDNIHEWLENTVGLIL